jgi:hypothetical protein
LDPQVGQAMAERLAGDLAERTGAAVPPGVPPAAYVAAVVQERQVREARRTFGGGPVAGQGPAWPGPSVGPVGPVPGPPVVRRGVGADPVVPVERPSGERPATGFVPPA